MDVARALSGQGGPVSAYPWNDDVAREPDAVGPYAGASFLVPFQRLEKGLAREGETKASAELDNQLGFSTPSARHTRPGALAMPLALPAPPPYPPRVAVNPVAGFGDPRVSRRDGAEVLARTANVLAGPRTHAVMHCSALWQIARGDLRVCRCLLAGSPTPRGLPPSFGDVGGSSSDLVGAPPCTTHTSPSFSNATTFSCAP